MSILCMHYYSTSFIYPIKIHLLPILIISYQHTIPHSVPLTAKLIPPLKQSL